MDLSDTAQEELRTACDYCSAAKLKCDKSGSACSQCQKRQITCRHSLKRRPGRRRRTKSQPHDIAVGLVTGNPPGDLASGEGMLVARSYPADKVELLGPSTDSLFEAPTRPGAISTTSIVALPENRPSSSQYIHRFHARKGSNCDWSDIEGSTQGPTEFFESVTYQPTSTQPFEQDSHDPFMGKVLEDCSMIEATISYSQCVHGLSTALSHESTNVTECCCLSALTLAQFCVRHVVLLQRTHEVPLDTCLYLQELVERTWKTHSGCPSCYGNYFIGFAFAGVLNELVTVFCVHIAKLQPAFPDSSVSGSLFEAEADSANSHECNKIFHQSVLKVGQVVVTGNLKTSFLLHLLRTKLRQVEGILNELGNIGSAQMEEGISIPLRFMVSHTLGRISVATEITAAVS